MNKELRIGNFVNHSGKPLLVNSINESGINSYIDDKYGESYIEVIEFKDLQPIPLNPELLERVGFKIGSGDFCRLGQIDFRYNADGLYFGSWGEVYFDNLSYCMKYLHQLQNLYFALTGNELEVNL